LDAEFGPLSTAEIVAAATSWGPGAVFIGHSGSTSAHPGIVKIARALKVAMPGVWTVYGGGDPTHHAPQSFSGHPEIDVIVRGEGEATSPRVLAGIESGTSLALVPGIAYREAGVACLTPPAAAIPELDAYRVGWELIKDWERYQYWGAGRAA